MTDTAHLTRNAPTSPTQDEDVEEPEIQVEESQEVCAYRKGSNVATSDELDSHDKEAVEFVKKGSFLTKVRSLTRTYRRYFYVNKEGTTLRYKGSQKRQSLCGTGKKSFEPKISVHDITEVRGEVRPGTILKRPHLAVVHHSGSRPSSAFTLIIGEAGKTLDLVAHNAKEKDLWVGGLSYLVKQSKEANFYDQHVTWLNEKFEEVDVNNDGRLQLEEVLKFMQSINVCPKITDELKDWCETTVLNKPEFIKLYEWLTKREKLYDIFRSVRCQE